MSMKASDFDEKFDAGEDMTSLLDLGKTHRPGLHAKQVNVDFPQWMSEEIMTISDIASYLKITEKTAYRLEAESKIPGFKIGGSWRFNKSEIQAWAKAKDKQPTSK